MLLEVKDVTKRYGDKQVLDGACLTVAAGEKVGIAGPSGAGKSTLARIIARLEAADAGTVTFDGVTVEAGRTPAAAEQRQIRQAWLGLQMVFQNPEASFSARMNIGDAIWEGAAYRPGFERGQKRQLVAEALDAVGLPRSAARKRAFELSGGECQRAAIARVIIGAPKLIVCDEPTSALDVTVQANIMALLEEIHATRHTAFLFISHNQPLLDHFCNRSYEI